jgi:putative transposase
MVPDALVPNHVQLIAVPQSADGLMRAVREAHRRYTRIVSFREGWRGHLWQGRFASFMLDETSLLTAGGDVPVRAGLAEAPSRYCWSSAMCMHRGTNHDLALPNSMVDD